MLILGRGIGGLSKYLKDPPNIKNEEDILYRQRLIYEIL